MRNFIKLATLTGLILLLSCTITYARDYNVNIITQDKLVSFADDGPFISTQGRTMVPIRFVAEALGMRVTWSTKSQTVELKNADSQINFQIGSLHALVNGDKRAIDSPAVLEGNRTYVPLRFISEIIDYRVTWVDKLRTAVIHNPNDLDYGALAPKIGPEPISADITVEARLTEIIREIIKPTMTDYERVLAVHDYIILNTAYDCDNYLAGTIPPASYQAEGVLLHGRAVCGGYITTFKLFMDSLGIECTMVIGTGNGGRHGWNQVKLGGDWYNIDLTWNDPAPDEPGKVRYTYFNVTDEELALDHDWDRSTAHPCTASKYNYYAMENTFFTTEVDFYNEITRQLNKEARSISVKTLGFEPDWQRITNKVFKYASRFRYYAPEVNELQAYIVTLTSFEYK